MHVMITGGAGFIGSNLTEYHLKKGDKVHVVDDLSTGSEGNVNLFSSNPQYRFTEADVLTWDGLERAASWADRIYHMAAVVGVFRVLEAPIKTLATNVAGCERVLRAAVAGQWRPMVLVASSSEVYGTGAESVRERGEVHGADAVHGIPEFVEDMEPMVGSSAVSRWNYSISKLTNEAFGVSYARDCGLPVVVVRFFNTIGPRQSGRYGMVVPRFVERAVNNEPLPVFGDGTQTRCFCDVRDTVAALDALTSNAESSGQIVNVGNDREVTIRGLAELVKARAHSDSPIECVPHDVAYGTRFQETLRRKPSLEKLEKLTGFRHSWTLEQTLDDLIDTRRLSAGA